MKPSHSAQLIFVILMLKLVQESPAHSVNSNQIRSKSAQDGSDVHFFKLPSNKKKRFRMRNPQRNLRQVESSARHSIQVKKYKSPSFKYAWNDPDPLEVNTFAALTATLNCSTKGYPKPSISWFKDGIEIQDDSDRPGGSKYYSMSKRRQIVKMEESMPSDNGNYTCIARNQEGFITRHFIVRIQPRVVAQEPIIQEGYPKNSTNLVGSNVLLECPISIVDASDPPEMTWVKIHRGTENDKHWKYPNGTAKIDVIQRCSARGKCIDSRTQMLNHDTSEINPRELYLVNLDLEDSTMYCCLASNTFGNVSSCAMVTVVEQLPDPKAAQKRILTISVVIPLACALCIVFVALMYAQKQKSKREKTDQIARSVVVWTKRVMISMENNELLNNDQPVLEPRVDIERRRATPSRFSESFDFSEYEYPCDPAWEFDRQKLKFLEPLGEGAFGLVSKAEAKIGKEMQIVAVKMLKEGHTDQDVIDLVKEMTIMKRIPHHDNIINLIGVCTQPMGCPLFVIVEYAKHGNLRDFLMQRRPGIPCEDCSGDYLKPDQGLISGVKKCTNTCVLSLEDLLNIGWQVAKGMEFLHLAKCVHRDLAARNVLVCENNLIKIADFGMARSIENSEYYRKNTEGKIPLKWMSPEAVHHRLYTPQSDVWSFGILLWEIMTMGESPFKDVPIDLFMERLKEGAHPSQPEKCPDNVFNFMCDCWRLNPIERPSWQLIVDRIHRLCASAEPYKYTIL